MKSIVTKVLLLVLTIVFTSIVNIPGNKDGNLVTVIPMSLNFKLMV